jgi:hypothetical protein
MHTTDDLQAIAHFISCYGLHRGDQFAHYNGQYVSVDISGIAYVVTEHTGIPAEFYTDEDASIRLIESSARAMAAIKAISQALDSAVCEDEIAPGHYVPNWIDHVSNWAATASPVHPKRPPTDSEVIGRVLRAANHTAQTPVA